MGNHLATSTTPSYDPRWFIWTIVFLIVAGISLVSYITISSYNESNNSLAEFNNVRATVHKPK